MTVSRVGGGRLQEGGGGVKCTSILLADVFQSHAASASGATGEYHSLVPCSGWAHQRVDVLGGVRPLVVEGRWVASLVTAIVVCYLCKEVVTTSTKKNLRDSIIPLESRLIPLQGTMCGNTGFDSSGPKTFIGT